VRDPDSRGPRKPYTQMHRMMDPENGNNVGAVGR
jgi:hypothetical protein